MIKELQALDTTIGILKEKMPKNDKSFLSTLENDLLELQAPKEAVYIPRLRQRSQKTAVKNKKDKTDVVKTETVLSTIKEFGRFIKRAEIDSKVEPFGISKDSIRFAMTYLKKTHVIISIHPTPLNSDTVWGLTEWTENGHIKPEYMYVDDIL